MVCLFLKYFMHIRMHKKYLWIRDKYDYIILIFFVDIILYILFPCLFHYCLAPLLPTSLLTYLLQLTQVAQLESILILHHSCLINTTLPPLHIQTSYIGWFNNIINKSIWKISICIYYTSLHTYIYWFWSLLYKYKIMDIYLYIAFFTQ